VAESSHGLWLWDGAAYAWGIDCAISEEGLLSPQTKLSDAAGGPEDDSEIFDPSGSLDIPDTC
jgi:hypothetical protein